ARRADLRLFHPGAGAVDAAHLGGHHRHLHADEWLVALPAAALRPRRGSALRRRRPAAESLVADEGVVDRPAAAPEQAAGRAKRERSVRQTGPRLGQVPALTTSAPVFECAPGPLFRSL